MVEFIFILVVVGILASILVPSSRDNRLREAADQVVSHIRYTQHLAMMDDKFSPGDDVWFKKRWQILFEQEGVNWYYTIFSDDDMDGNPQSTEIAKNPQNPSQRLTGATADNATQDLNLGKTYGIIGATGVTFNNNCGAGNRRIVFDYIGRPMQSDPKDYGRPYTTTNLITSTTPHLCTITLTDNSGRSANITIQPETGFAQVLPF
ncbi:MAG: type II/IV secretion system protein [Campylobacteraceae bacterium]|nr:type II/IV secretion system protein [Campylobacteraceae bacterium]